MHSLDLILTLAGGLGGARVWLCHASCRLPYRRLSGRRAARRSAHTGFRGGSPHGRTAGRGRHHPADVRRRTAVPHRRTRRRVARRCPRRGGAKRRRDPYIRELLTLKVAGANVVFSDESEVALAFTETILSRLGATPSRSIASVPECTTSFSRRRRKHVHPTFCEEGSLALPNRASRTVSCSIRWWTENRQANAVRRDQD
jgi:hypothetical protein